MKASWTTGLSFGLTSGVITTLGLMVGLHAGTHSRAVVLGGIVTIAVADALSDALGIHITEEANRRSSTHVWESTAVTFLAKLVSAASFAVPVLWLPLEDAVMLSLAWGFGLLAVLSWMIARTQRLPAWTIVGEHLVIASAVVAATFYLGRWINAVMPG